MRDLRACGSKAMRRFAVLAIVVLQTAVHAQIQVKSEDASMKLGVLGQVWADFTQTPTVPQSYEQNLYLRRVRIIAGGEIGKDLSFFLQTDSPNLGKTPKTPGSGFMLQDAFLEWRASNTFRVDGGLFLVPLSRNTLQSPVSYYTLDISRLTTINNSATQSAGLRDLGFGARGFFLKDKLQYRFGIFQGERDSNSRDSLRTSGYVQYDFWDSETGYTFLGTALGTKKILAIDAGYDAQGSYHGVSANIAIDRPVLNGDEIGGQFQFFYYDGANKFPTIHKQDDWLVESSYYIHRFRIQPVAKLDAQRFVSPTDSTNNLYRAGCGLNYYIHGQNLKWTMQWVRTFPKETTSFKASDEFTVQLQAYYF